MATKTAVIVLCDEAVLIWAIPPLLPQPPDFFDHNPTRLPSPLFTIPFPDDIALHTERVGWNVISSWYFSTSHPLYFEALCQDSKLHRFQIMLKPDLSAASLHVIHTSELTPHDFKVVSFHDARICEDTLVSCWSGGHQSGHGLYTGLTSTRFADIISHSGPAAKMLILPNIGCEYHLFSCPTSGRFVLLDRNNSVSVLDLFWYILIICRGLW